MQIFDLFMKILRKKLPTAFVFIAVFIGISIPMSKNDTAEKSFKDTKLKITVFDDDNTAESRAFTDMLFSKHKRVEIPRDKDEMTEALYFEVTNYIIVINKGYSEKLAAGETDGLFTSYHVHEWFSLTLTDQLIDNYISSINAYTAAGEDISSAVYKAGEAVSAETEVRYETFAENSGCSKSVGTYFNYIPYILLSVVISALCPVLHTMNSREVRFRTNCSCLRTSSYSIQVIAGSTVFVIAEWLVIMVVGAIVNGAIYSGKDWLVVLNSFVFLLVATSIALLICTFEPPENVIGIVVQVIGLGMSFLCGIFVPQSMLGSGVLSAARFLPAYWYVRANDMLSGKIDFSGRELAVCMLIEAGFAVTLLLASVVIHRIKNNSTSLRFTARRLETEH